MKFAVAALLGCVSAISLKNEKKDSDDCPTSQQVFSYNEKVGTATGFLQLSACSASGISGAGLTCIPDHQLFATGMNGDEDLGQDIIMKGKPFHYNQKSQALFATGMNGDEDLGQDIIMKGKPFHYNQAPANATLFATGMNGDEDLGQDIIMKGKPFHYNQAPANATLFATGMNGDEDLGQDIIMKGKPFHYNQQKSQALFATGMNGDEDLGQDIIMKGKPFHYDQKSASLAQWTPVVVESTGPLPKCHGNNGPDGVNCAKEVCSGTNGPVDGPSGTPCTREEPDSVPHYNTDPQAGRPYQTSGDITKTSPEATSAHSWPASQTFVQLAEPPVEDEAEKVSVLQTPWGHTHTTYY